MPESKALALYMPVLHRGYIDFFAAFPEIDTAYVFGPDILKSVDYLRKDLRALSPKSQSEVLRALGIFKEVKILSRSNLKKITADNLIMPDEDISREVAKRLDSEVTFYPVFLRWDRQNVNGANQLTEGVKLSRNKEAVGLMRKASGASGKSSDIWRRVGALVRTASGVILGPETNQAEPSSHSPWLEGDPRNVFSRGVGIEMSVFTHAEAALIAEAAKQGIKLEGAEIYVTVFPCPACAKLIAHSGIKRCYFAEGYAVLDGARVMQDYGVELARVRLGNEEAPDEKGFVPYKSS